MLVVGAYLLIGMVLYMTRLRKEDRHGMYNLESDPEIQFTNALAAILFWPAILARNL